MKRIVASIIILLMSMCVYQISYAVEGENNIPVNFTGATTVSQDTQTITLTLSVGDFSGISGNVIMGYEAILEYDKNIFSSVTVEGLNNWIAQYDENTQRIEGDTTAGEPNKDIAKITLTLNENATLGTTPVSLKEGLLSINDDDNLDTKFEKEIQITIKEIQDEQEGQENTPKEDNKPEEASKDTTNTGDTATYGNTAIAGNSDKTTTANTLPKTGMVKTATIVFLVLAIGIGCLIRYKSIEIK